MMKLYILAAVVAATLTGCGPVAEADGRSCEGNIQSGFRAPSPADCDQWRADVESRKRQEAIETEARDRKNDADLAARRKQDDIDKAKRTYHLRYASTLVCTSAEALLTLMEPNARERLGEINYMATVANGGCVEIGNRHALQLGMAGRIISGMFLPTSEISSVQVYVANRDLIGYDGLPPH